jgi:hypothetical protein
MNLDLWIGIGVALTVISGGIIARIKGDYFSRGMGITLFTSIFGIIALIVSHPSRARTNDEHDMQGWPPNSYIAVFTTMSLVFILLLRYWLF